MGRLIAYLNRSYTCRETAVLLLSTVVILLAAQIAADAAGISRPVAATLSLIAALGTFLALAALIDRRGRCSDATEG